MGVSTVAAIVKKTVEFLWEVLQPKHMPVPNEETFLNIAKDHHNIWKFPNCIGVIDGKHVRIVCPAHSGTMYYNYKSFYSIVLQGLVDANYKFSVIDVGGYGKPSDGGTFRASQLFKLIHSNELNIPQNYVLPGSNTTMPFVFIADEAYPLMPNLLKPYSKTQLNADAEYFNKRLSRARKTVECAFGIIYSK